MRSWKTPTEADVDRALALAAGAQQRRYFFDKLENPLWLRPLWARGLFQYPPPPEESSDRKTVRFPPWPLSRYLARVASFDPELAIEVALEIPDNGNVSVYEDLVDVGIAVPAVNAAKIARRAQKWAESPYQWLLPDKLAKLTVHLATGGQTDAAIRLGRQLLGVLPDPRIEKGKEMPQGVLVPEPRTRYDQWRYQEVLRTDVPVLVRATGIEGLRMLCDLLEHAVRLSLKPDSRASSDDFSYIWRPAIEDHEQNGPDGVKALLAVAVRDAAELLVKESLANLEDVLNELTQRNRPVYARISLHLLRLFGESARGRVTAALVNRANFDAVALRHEYALLSQKRFGELKEGEQRQILDWIASGTDRTRIAEFEIERTGKPPSEQEVDRVVRLRQRDRLAPIRSHLPESWRLTYRSLVAELGPPQHPEFLIYSEGFRWGAESPLSIDELRNRSIEQVADYLKTWKPAPEETWGGPSPEGLAETLTTAVRDQAEAYSRGAARFRTVHPTYVRAFFRGLHDALKEEKNIAWGETLALADWVVDSARAKKEIPALPDGDPGWASSLTGILDLLEVGLVQNRIEPAFREHVWRVLNGLTKMDDAAVKQQNVSGIRGLTVAINSVTGRAIQTILTYAEWVTKRADSGDSPRRALQATPEVSELLELYLAPGAPPSPPIHSLLGALLPKLLWLDREWTSERIQLIFSRDSQDLRKVTWQSFVSFSSPSKPLFELLQEEYRWAVGQIGTFKLESGYGATDDHLAEHLVQAYLWGLIPLDQGVLPEFYASAGPSVRAYAMEYLGRGLYNMQAPIPNELLARAQALWAERREAGRISQDPQSNNQELSRFGWWFASGKFDDKWSLDELISLLEATHQLDPGFLVAKRLVELAHRFPVEAMVALKLLIDADQQGPGINGWLHDARSLLEIVMIGSSPEARRLAVATIHRLGEAGYEDYRDLLRYEPTD